MNKNKKSLIITSLAAITLICSINSVSSADTKINPPVNPFPNAYELSNNVEKKYNGPVDGINPPVNPFNYRKIKETTSSTESSERFTFSSETSTTTTSKTFGNSSSIKKSSTPQSTSQTSVPDGTYIRDKNQ